MFRRWDNQGNIGSETGQPGNQPDRLPRRSLLQINSFHGRIQPTRLEPNAAKVPHFQVCEQRQRGGLWDFGGILFAECEFERVPARKVVAQAGAVEGRRSVNLKFMLVYILKYAFSLVS